MPGLTRVVCFGLVVADRIFEVEVLPAGEGKFTATSYRESGGGIAGTASVAIAALGGAALFCGAIGDDAAGAFLQSELARHGVDLSGLHVDPGARTPSSAVMVDNAGGRCLVVDRGTARARLPGPELLSNAGALLIDHRYPDLARSLLLSTDLPCILDAEGGESSDLRSLAALVHFPIFSRNGLRAATDDDDPATALRRVDAPHARATAVTLGEAGSLWLIRGDLHHVPAPHVRASDTTGCGDVFHGAFALAVAEGQPPLQAARFATSAAALKAVKGNGWRGMPRRPEIDPN